MKELRHTAYHEAGHAVAAVRLHVPFHYVTIMPDAGSASLGHILRKKFSARFNPEIEITLRDKDLIERIAVGLYAGAAAAGLLNRRQFDWSGADRDQQDALDLISRLEFDAETCSAYMNLISLRARNLIRQYRTDVKLVADALLERTRLRSSEVRRIVFRLPAPGSYLAKIPPIVA